MPVIEGRQRKAPHALPKLPIESHYQVRANPQRQATLPMQRLRTAICRKLKLSVRLTRDSRIDRPAAARTALPGWNRPRSPGLAPLATGLRQPEAGGGAE
mgnify:CR=1 FL=1